MEFFYFYIFIIIFDQTAIKKLIWFFLIAELPFIYNFRNNLHIPKFSITKYKYWHNHRRKKKGENYSK